jgi:hypothetical protein
VFVEPRGSRDVGDTYSIDLQLSKGLRLGSERLALIGTVYNLLDTEQPTAVCDRLTGCGAALRLGDPLAWQQTRSFEVGVRYEH